MHSDGFFWQAFVYLTAAVLSVPIAKRLGLGSVLGYLIAGAIIGPYALGLVGEEGQDVMHFAEFGVVMMLFLVGLELQPSLLWRLRGPILGMGGMQVGLTTLAIAGLAIAAGLSWQMALAIGLTLALSSTAIVLQTLNEKGLMKTPAGESCFSVLLFQDIAVIPMLALMPLLAFAGADSAHEEHASAIAHLPGWQQALIVLLLIGTIVVVGRLLMRPIFRFIASTQLREIFTATALLLVIGIALAMQSVGLSAALGTFVAGVVLAESEYRHELEGDIEPFKGLLLGLFFISVGANIDFALIGTDPGLILSLVGALVVVKLLVLFVTGRVFKLAMSQNFLFAFSLAQGGEFAFVLFSFAVQNSVLTPTVANPLVAAVAVSMALTPLLMIINEKLIQPRFATAQSQREPDTIDEENAVIIAGYGRFGHVVGRLLKANGVATTVLDLDPEQIEILGRFGHKVFYGDAGRTDLLHAAGAHSAKLLLLAIDDPEKTNLIAKQVRQHYPQLRVMARAESLHHTYELMHIGIDSVFRETYDTALAMGVEALKAVGFRAYQAQRAARTFKRHDTEAMRDLYQHWKDQKNYLALATERVNDLEQLLTEDARDQQNHADHAWDAPPPIKANEEDPT
ncbi:MAG: monovalent cation:proton antiporter-2 (CPA2) family protein [Candidatus Latescibacterota bacterium]|jgi:monovalent cation:proton antiporter-2 (CPA2) family protein